VRWIAAVALIALCGLSPLAGVGTASADPGSNCAGLHDVRLCDLSKTYFCPDTGTYLPALTPCPAYVIGPHRAGMPPDDVTPNGGIAQ
jgi:hypothetical protein